MDNRIYLQELAGYKKMSESNLIRYKINGSRFFDLSQLPSIEIQEQLRKFIFKRGTKLSIVSLSREITPYKVLCKYLNKKHKNIKSIRDKNLAELTRGLKAWLLQNGYQISYQKNTSINSYQVEVESVVYLRKLYEFLAPLDNRQENEKDIWVLSKLNIHIRINPIKNIKTINFSAIPQEGIKEEIKQVIYMELKNVALGTVLAEMSAIRRFTKYLGAREKQVKSLQDVSRETIEKYLTYLNTEVTGKASFRTELIYIKTVLGMFGKIVDAPNLNELFIQGDIPGQRQPQFKALSDQEMERLNREIVKMDEQMARALIIHQILGTRISDTLTLRPDCLFKSQGRWMIRIHQVKSRYYEKAVDQEVVQLIQKAINYTKERYGETKYIFVCNSDINRPYQYSMIQYRVTTMIYKKDLRTDEGKLYGFDTHMGRRRYGKKLTEMHIDDYTISRLLGHANISSVSHYRQMDNNVLAEESKEMRDTMDEILTDLIKDWSD